MPDDLVDTISDAATEPASASGDGQSMSARSIDDMIKADQYGKAATAAEQSNDFGGRRSPWNGLRPARVVPPGAS